MTDFFAPNSPLLVDSPQSTEETLPGKATQQTPFASNQPQPLHPFSSAESVVIDSLQKNGSIHIDGEMYRILNFVTSKTGKHGSSRTYIAAEHTSTGMKIERVIPTNNHKTTIKTTNNTQAASTDMP